MLIFFSFFSTLVVPLFVFFGPPSNAQQKMMYPLGPCLASPALTITSYNATFYGSSCSIKRFTATGPQYDHVGAPIGFPILADHLPCGVCYELIGSKGSQRIMMTNGCGGSCGTSEETRIDVALETLPFLFVDGTGVEVATYREITCDVEGPVKYEIFETASIWWFAVTFFNHITGLARAEIRGAYPSTTGWIEMDRPNWGFSAPNSEDGSGYTFPFTVRVTDFYGDQIEFEVADIVGGEIRELSRQFDFPSVVADYAGSCCRPPEVWSTIYSNGELPMRWQDWGGLVRDLRETTSPHSGSYCLRVDFGTGVSMLQFGAQNEARVDQYEFLEFYARTTESSGITFDELEVRLLSSWEDEIEPLWIPVPGVTDTWQRFRIPIANNVPFTTISSISLSSSAGPISVFFDDIVLTPMPGAPDTSRCAPGISEEMPPGMSDPSTIELIAYVVAGVVSGTFLICALIIVLIVSFCCCCRRRKEMDQRMEDKESQRSTSNDQYSPRSEKKEVVNSSRQFVGGQLHSPRRSPPRVPNRDRPNVELRNWKRPS